MPQRVGADAHARAARRDVPADQAIDASHRETRASIIDKQWIPGFLLASDSGAPGASGFSVTCPNDPPTIFQVRPERGCRAGVERHDALFAAFAEHAHHL